MKLKMASVNIFVCLILFINTMVIAIANKSLGDMTISWYLDAMNTTATITMDVSSSKYTWLALGIAETSGSMIGTDAFMYNPTTSKVEEYILVDTDFSDFTPVLPSQITTVSNSIGDGLLSVTFSRRLSVTGSAKGQNFSLTGFTNAVYAYGPTWGQQHTDQGSAQIDIMTGTVHVIPEKNTLQIIHGSVMVASLGVLMPLGVMMARFLKGLPKTVDGRDPWFICHRSVQIFASCLAISGFCIALYFTSHNHGKHFNCLHSIIGLMVLVVVLSNPIFSVLRPPKLHYLRWVWELAHFCCGYGGLLMAGWAIILGLIRIDASNTFLALYITTVFSLIILYTGLQARQNKKQGELHDILKEGEYSALIR